MTLHEVIKRVGDGDVPMIDEMLSAFNGSGDATWNARMAIFGNMDAAIMFCNIYDLKWRASYDNMGVVTMPDGQEIKVVSVTPSHALIMAAMQAIALGA